MGLKKGSNKSTKCDLILTKGYMAGLDPDHSGNVSFILVASTTEVQLWY